MKNIELNPIPFKDLELRKYPPKKPSLWNKRICVGFDTETLHGYAKLLCTSDKQYVFIDTVDDALHLLTEHRYRNRLNFFFNIQYDFDAIIKHLPPENIRELAYNNQTVYEKYKIENIPKKSFRIRVNRDVYKFYDVANFFESTLESAAQTHLGESKFIVEIDRAKLGSDETYWQNNIDEIVNYCTNDAVLTAKLAELLQSNISKTCAFYPKTYVSKASVAKQYFKLKCDIPNVRKIPTPVLEMAFHSYFGGRFEVTERGNIGETTSLDIVSAYPNEIANLLDVTAGKWSRVTKFNEDTPLGFYLCRVTVPYLNLPPIPRRWKGIVYYPLGRWGCYLSSDEIRAYRKDIDIEIITGYEFEPETIKYPFREAILTLFAKKQQSQKGTMEYKLYKIMMNSLYGAFYEKIRMPDGSIKTGQLFNPVYASLITSRTRIKLYEMIKKFENKVVSLATDGILVKGAVNMESGRELGEWEVSEPAETIILRSGIYSYGKTLKQRGVMKSKYFHTPYGDFDNLFDYILQMPNLQEYPILSHRPRHLKECARMSNPQALERINHFENVEIVFDLAKDNKRVWLNKPTSGRDLIEKHFTSMPWSLFEYPYAL